MKPHSLPSRVTRRSLLRAGAALAVPLVGCGSEDDADTRVQLHTRIELDREAWDEFTITSGDRVRLERAVLGLGALYYGGAFEDELASRSPGRLERLLGALVPSAHAHPGHFSTGSVLGQWLGPRALDFSEAPLELPGGQGLMGSYSIGQVVYAPLEGNDPFAYTIPIASLDAVAVREDGEVPFRVAATLEDVWPHAPEGTVHDCRFEAAEVSGDGTVVVRVDPRVWLETAELAELGPSDDRLDLGSNTQVGRAFALGLAQSFAYTFFFEG